MKLIWGYKTINGRKVVSGTAVSNFVEYIFQIKMLLEILCHRNLHLSHIQRMWWNLEGQSSENSTISATKDCCGFHWVAGHTGVFTGKVLKSLPALAPDPRHHSFFPLRARYACSIAINDFKRQALEPSFLAVKSCSWPSCYTFLIATMIIADCIGPCRII